jgi:lipopolysaccharide export system permease protein
VRFTTPNALILRIDRHIGTTVIKSMLVVLLAFVGLNVMFQLIDELREKYVGYGLSQAVVYVLLTLPRRIYELIPYVAFLGTLVGLGQLANQGELTVLRAAGVSVRRLFLSASIPASGALVFALLLGEYLAPLGEEAAEGYKAQARQSSATIRFWGGHWYREGGLFMDVAAIDAGGQLVGIRQYFLDEHRQLKIARQAAFARYLPNERAWMLSDVQETLLDEERTQSRHLDEVRWPSDATPELLGIRVLLGPANLSIRGLATQIAYMNREELDASRYRLAYWSKLLQPFAILGLVLLALCFVIGPLREVSMGTRLAVGTLVGLAFKYLEDLLGPMSMVYHLPAAAAVAAPILICWLTGIWMLRRSQ